MDTLPIDVSCHLTDFFVSPHHEPPWDVVAQTTQSTTRDDVRLSIFSGRILSPESEPFPTLCASVATSEPFPTLCASVATSEPSKLLFPHASGTRTVNKLLWLVSSDRSSLVRWHPW